MLRWASGIWNYPLVGRDPAVDRSVSARSVCRVERSCRGRRELPWIIPLSVALTRLCCTRRRLSWWLKSFFLFSLCFSFNLIFSRLRDEDSSGNSTFPLVAFSWIFYPPSAVNWCRSFTSSCWKFIQTAAFLLNSASSAIWNWNENK